MISSSKDVKNITYSKNDIHWLSNILAHANNYWTSSQLHVE
jgi:hypothetical protein